MATNTMKGTRAFQDTIAQYLMGRAEKDPILAIKLANPSKNMEQCCQFIINQVKESGCCGFADEEIYNWALHFWDEPEIEVGEPANCQVVVNHVVELTQEEKAQSRQDAIARLRDEEMAKMRKATQPKKASTESKQPIQEPNLFGEDF